MRVIIKWTRPADWSCYPTTWMFVVPLVMNSHLGFHGEILGVLSGTLHELTRKSSIVCIISSTHHMSTNIHLLMYWNKQCGFPMDLPKNVGEFKPLNLHVFLQKTRLKY